MHYDSFAFAKDRSDMSRPRKATILTRSGRLIRRRCPPRGWKKEPRCHKTKVGSGLGLSEIDVRGINRVYRKTKGAAPPKKKVGQKTGDKGERAARPSPARSAKKRRAKKDASKKYRRSGVRRAKCSQKTVCLLDIHRSLAKKYTPKPSAFSRRRTKRCIKANGPDTTRSDGVRWACGPAALTPPKRRLLSTFTAASRERLPFSCWRK